MHYISYSFQQGEDPFSDHYVFNMLCGDSFTLKFVCYVSSGFESPSEWDDHNRFFALDGPDPHYTVSF